ncbi:MAG TPA: hypothetical protein VKI44_25290 [Acetobacteraceae bacterium]|nr:hypothetical protein [Acetobacteraceae bacterium]
MTNARMHFLAATALLFVAAPVLAQSTAPDATLTLSGGSLAAGAGYTWGNGVLQYDDKSYTFTVNGLSVADIGASHIEGVGDVYNLRNSADFAGNYVAAGAGATVAGGGSVAALENEHGVIIHFRSTTQGLRLNAAANGIYIAFRD